MFTVYKGNVYRFTEKLLNKEKFVSGITTKDKKKTDGSFDFKEKTGNYYKFVDRAELFNLYSISFSVDYNTDIKELRREWDIFGRGAIDSEQKRILLLDYYGIPSGWKVEEKGVGSKWVDISELSNLKIVYKYFIKAGAECSPPVIEKDIIEYTDDDEIIKRMLAIFEYYDQI